KLTAEEKRIVRAWIASGAHGEAAAVVGPTEPERQITDEDRQFWSFRSPVRPPLAGVRPFECARNALDTFFMAALEKKGHTLSPEADRLTLLRRAYCDLIGLPPSPNQVTDFLADDSPDAYERLVDRLLASPHYGERWGRHWLDLAGYADSEGI